MTRSRDIADSTKTLDVDGGTIKLDGNYPNGTNNVGLGDGAFAGSLSGDSNVAIGYQSHYSLTSGNANTSVGRGSGFAITTGTSNVAVGYTALSSNTTASYNTAVGYQALTNNTTAGYNTAVGHRSGHNNTTGLYNTFIGEQAGENNTTTGANVYVGHYAGNFTTSNSNTFIGTNSGYQIISGSKNTILGPYNGIQGGLDIRNSNNNIVLSDGDGNPRMRINNVGSVAMGTTDPIRHGQITKVLAYNGSTTTGDFALHVGRVGTGSENQICITNGYGKVGSVTTSGTSTSYNTSSDHRLKENVNYTWDATTRLKQLKPARFNFISDADTTVDGFLAHEAQAVVPECVTGAKDAVDADGNPEYQGIDQSKLVPLLVKTIQELEARITALEA